MPNNEYVYMVMNDLINTYIYRKMEQKKKQIAEELKKLIQDAEQQKTGA